MNCTVSSYISALVAPMHIKYNLCTWGYLCEHEPRSSLCPSANIPELALSRSAPETFKVIYSLSLLGKLLLTLCCAETEEMDVSHLTML